MFSWLEEHLSEIAINLSTELIGTVVAIGVSIYAANYLDQRVEKRKRDRTAQHLCDLMTQLNRYVCEEIWDDPSLSTNPSLGQAGGPNWARTNLASTMDRYRQRVLNAVDLIESHHAHLLSSAQINALEDSRDVIQRASSCLSLTSHLLRQQLADGVTLSNIALTHASWAVQSASRLHGNIAALRECFQIRKAAALAPIPADLEDRYKKLFEYLVDDERQLAGYLGFELTS